MGDERGRADRGGGSFPSRLMPDHHDEPRSPTAERDERPKLYAWVCPECGDQNNQDRHMISDATTYCLRHEDELGRKERPAHVQIEVAPADSPRPEERELREAIYAYFSGAYPTGTVATRRDAERILLAATAEVVGEGLNAEVSMSGHPASGSGG